MDMNTIKNVAKAMTTKESIKLMRDATATSVAGSIVGITVRNAMYKRSKTKNGWYSRYIDNPFVQKRVKADDKSVIISAVIATALDTVLYLDRCGFIKLRSNDEIANDLETNVCPEETDEIYDFDDEDEDDSDEALM